MVLEGYSGFQPSKYKYFARNPFTYSEILSNEIKTSDNFFVYNTGIYIEPKNPYGNCFPAFSIGYVDIAGNNESVQCMHILAYGGSSPTAESYIETYRGTTANSQTITIDFYNLIQSGQSFLDINLALQAFRMTGGQVRFYEKGAISFDNSNGRTYGFTFEPQGAGIGYCRFQLNNAQVAGNVQYCFARLNNETVNFLAFNSPSGDGFSTTNPGSPTPIQGLFQNLGASKWGVDVKNCVFSFTGIDFNKVDLTLLCIFFYRNRFQ